MYSQPAPTPAPAARLRGACRPVPALLALALLLASAGAAWSKPPARNGASAKPAAAAKSSVPRVDSARVKRLYLDGEFDAAIAILEDNLKDTRPYSHGDSVFILKHLGVMYAAQYDTREKGKYYMHRLLEVEPGAKIMDMYASDMIYMIFKNIQEEYEQTRMALESQRSEAPRRGGPRAEPAAPEAPPAAARPASRPAQAAPPSGHGKRWLWAGVAAATVATGVGAYVVMNEKPASPSPTVKESRF